MFLIKKWGILIKKESESLIFGDLKIPRDYQLEEEIESILNFIEDTTYNAAQGYHMYKLLRDKRTERKQILKEVICMEALQEQVDCKKMAGSFQSSLDNASRRIQDANRISIVKELQMEDHDTAQNRETDTISEKETINEQKAS